MANPKSNIYPIQLQGAELNLNKYDAEIKQYSGFNKNNSPFVGGCLSNVFTKEQQIEGGNDDNVYIDENGDKYEVDTSGLKKNNEYVINFPENTVFWEREKKTPNNNVIKFYSDAVKIVKVDNETTWQYKIQGLETSETDYIAEVAKSEALSDEEMAAYFIGAFIKKDNNLFFVVFCAIGYKFCIVKIQVTESGLVFLGRQTKDLTVNYISKNSSIFVSSKTDPNWIVCFLGGNIAYISVKFDMSFIGEVYTEFQSIVVLSGYTYLPSVYITDYCISSYPINTIKIKRPPQLNIRANQGLSFPDSLYVVGVISDVAISSSNGKIVGALPNSSIVLSASAIYDIIATDATTQEPQRYGDIYNQNSNLLKGTLSKLVSCYDFQIATKRSASDDARYFFLLHITSQYERYFKNRPSLGFAFEGSHGNYVFSDFVSCGDTLNFAFNNNAFSAICGKNVLLSNWNELTDEDLNTFEYSLFWDNGVIKEGLVYSYKKETFYLKNGKPKLNKLLNQIVCNADCMENSFDVIRNKVLHYASAFNGVYNDFDDRCELCDPSITRTSNVYIGAAVKEYNLEDNSSIILNPVSFFSSVEIVQRLIGVFLGAGNSSTSVYGFTDDKVDIYVSALDSPQVIYRYTIKGKTFNSLNNQVRNIDKKLIDLPYPTDTNGNVTYSPSLFGKIVSQYGNNAFYLDNDKGYPLNVGNNNRNVFNFYLGSEIEGFENAFIIQGQYYGVINNSIFSMQYNNGVISGVAFVVSVEGLQFVGNTPYEALFFSKTNRCLYSFTGANVLNQKQLVDKISEVRNYLYNPATQTVFLITDIGILFYGLFGVFLLEYTNISSIFLLENGIVMSDNSGNYRFIKYYLDTTDEDFIKQNIKVDTCFYGMNNQTVTINDCVYFRLFSEEHEEGELKVSATTISLSGRKTEETTFKIKASDWDKITHTIYLRYQPKAQRGLGVSFSIDSPFKIASISVGSTPDAILVDKVSKGAITAPSVTTNNNEW